MRTECCCERMYVCKSRFIERLSHSEVVIKKKYIYFRGQNGVRRDRSPVNIIKKKKIK